MRTIVVDDEYLAIERFKSVSSKIKDVEIVGTFTDSSKALEYASTSKVDLAILDIEMGGDNGIEVGKKLHELDSKILIIYITGYDSYALKAFQVHAISYILKPYNVDEVQYAIESAKLLLKRSGKKVHIRTFGLFDVFIDNVAIFFRHKKTKELLALLVDEAGGVVTSSYAISILWENKPFDDKAQSLYYKSAKDLEKVLKENGIDEIMIKDKGQICLNMDYVDCDYYNYLEGRDWDRFRGKYMSQYSWGEATLANLQFKKK